MVLAVVWQVCHDRTPLGGHSLGHYHCPRPPLRTRTKHPPEIRTVVCINRWMQEARFARLPGVVKTRVGYTGGTAPNPSYNSVCAGDGHTEAMRVWFDPSVITYEQLLQVRGRLDAGCAHWGGAGLGGRAEVLLVRTGG